MSRKISLTPEVFKIDACDWCTQIEAFISEKFVQSHRDGIVIPVSGGLDSSVVATLCTRAIGKDKVIGLMLPERFGNPEANYYGRLITKHLDIQTMEINISPILRSLKTSNIFHSVISGRERWKNMVGHFLHKSNQTVKTLYMDALSGKLDTSYRKLLAEISSKQRARLLVTYKVAEEHNLMVAGSSHKTEQMVGLFVKYGIDDAADIMPLKNMYRSQVLQLAKFIGIPSEIINRAPNPDFLPGITDKYKDYFGIDYQKIELIILGRQLQLSSDVIAKQLDLDNQTVLQIFESIQGSERTRSHAQAPELK